MIRSLEELFHSQLQEALSAEIQLFRILGAMEETAICLELKDAFHRLRTETQIQIERLKQACQEAGCPAGFEACKAIEGMIVETKALIAMEMEETVREAALIIAVQKMKHYEMALYGGLCALAYALDKNDLSSLLHLTLDEEKQADKNLSELAEHQVNAKAAASKPSAPLAPIVSPLPAAGAMQAPQAQM